jgi:toxin ParE1/3/4
MDFRVIWSEAALGDLREIVCYIARDNAVAAERMGRLILGKIEALARFPRTGRMVPEHRRDDLREIIVAPYRVVFLIDDAKGLLHVVRVRHGARKDLGL